MARQGTAKQAIDAQNGVTPSPTPVVPPVAPVAPVAPTPINTPSPTPITPTTPRVEGQWNYGTNEAQVLGEKPTVAPTQPTPTVKPASASQAIAQGFKQEIKPVAKGANAPLTTEIGREAKLGQLPTVQQAQNQAEQDRINTANLKSQSGQQLWSNLESISGANTSLLNDRKAFDQAFGYDNKDVSEKALVDAFWKSKRLDANGIYNSLATGATIPKESKNTPAFTDALIRHQDTTRFENLNPYQLSKVINSELIPGTQTYNDLMAKNPQLVTDAMKLASINTPVTARDEPKTNWQDNLSAYLSRSPVMQNQTTVATIMNSDPNIATKTNEVQAVEDKLTEAKDRLKKVQENVTERYKGTGATKQTINAKALAESQDIIDEITMLEANKASASSALTTLIQNAKDNYTYARQDREDALAQYNKGFAQLQAMAEMGMKQDAQEYQKQQDSVNRDLQLLQYYTNIDQANAKEARGYNFQTQQDLRNFDQQKELAKMGYNNQYNLANLGFNQDMAKLGMQQAYSTAQNATAQQNEMIKAAMSQGATYQDAVNQVMGTGSGLGDIRGMANQFPNQAWAKNNNPAGITWNANFENMTPGSTADKLRQAGIQFSKGTDRPASEGGNYVTFPTIEDGLAAQRIIMTETYGNSTVGQMLSSWVGTSEGANYAKQVAGNAGIDLNAKVNTLDDQQIAQLQMAKIAKESPGLAKLLQQGGGQTMQSSVQPEASQYPSYVKYIESGVLPAGMKEGSQKAQQFQQQAQQGYTDAKNATFKQQGFELSNPQAFASTTPKQREEINNAVMQVSPFIKTMDELIALTDKYGTENPYSAAGREMNQKVKNAQLIAKEIYNLGVLNGPDLSLMEAIIPRPTSFEANTIGVTQNYGDLLREAKNTILGNAISKAQSVGLTQIGSSTQGQSNAPVNQKTYDDVMSRVQARRQSLNK